MRARPARSRRKKGASSNQSLKINLLLLFLSLLFLAGTSRLFYMVTAQRLYQPIEWRINKIAMKTHEPAPVKKQAKEQDKTKVQASGMDYLFWDILRDEKPVNTH
jgi:hypothetical protein